MNITELELRQQFKNLSDCYADTWVDIGTEMQQGEVIQAMTEDRFIELLKKVKLLPIHNVVGSAITSDKLEKMKNILKEYIVYKKMLTNTNTPTGLYGIDSKVRELHRRLIENINDEFNNKLIVSRLNWILSNINRVLSRKKALNFFIDNADDISDDLYYWIVNNARVRNWLTKENVKRPEWF